MELVEGTVDEEMPLVYLMMTKAAEVVALGQQDCPEPEGAAQN